jgi:hypothetical protein
MTFIWVYLAGYFLLVGGAALVLWQAGVLARLPPLWTALGLLVAVGLGVLLAVAFARPRTLVSDRRD